MGALSGRFRRRKPVAAVAGEGPRRLHLLLRLRKPARRRKRVQAEVVDGKRRKRRIRGNRDVAGRRSFTDGSFMRFSSSEGHMVGKNEEIKFILLYFLYLI